MFFLIVVFDPTSERSLRAACEFSVHCMCVVTAAAAAFPDRSVFCVFRDHNQLYSGVQCVRTQNVLSVCVPLRRPNQMSSETITNKL